MIVYFAIEVKQHATEKPQLVILCWHRKSFLTTIESRLLQRSTFNFFGMGETRKEMVFRKSNKNLTLAILTYSVCGISCQK